MIFDTLKNADLYYGISPNIKTALEYLQNADLNSIENGKYEIEGNDIFAIIQDYQTKPLNEGKWEAHREYTDIQHIIKGREKLGYLNIDEFMANTGYDDEKDIVFGEGNGDFVTAKEGCFLIFTPEDAHMPGLCASGSEYVKKAVIKVKM